MQDPVCQRPRSPLVRDWVHKGKPSPYAWRTPFLAMREIPLSGTMSVQEGKRRITWRHLCLCMAAGREDGVGGESFLI